MDLDDVVAPWLRDSGPPEVCWNHLVAVEAQRIAGRLLRPSAMAVEYPHIRMTPLKGTHNHEQLS